MKREVTNCLLCNVPLNEMVTWKTLLTNAYPKTICKDCENKFEPYPPTGEGEVMSLYQYNEAMKDYLHRYKFMHDVVLAKVFRNQIHKALNKMDAAIVPIPMHPVKLKERTFAHVDELLKAANINFEHFLDKITLETQGEKTREERITTPQIFKLKVSPDKVKNQNILLVDDIYTTGTTISHAKNLLLEAGANSVTAFTLIRV
ncbi:phosphoribosyltransferase family protein [Ureibacillus composti]|nr:phosphoribosyltransferase family protein [Ureibacillus composti]